MKKTYVKPTVDIEDFVANEYVAACYLVTCATGGESEIMVLAHEPTNDWGGTIPNVNIIGLIRTDDDRFGSSTGHKWLYGGTINGVVGEQREGVANLSGYAHILTGKPQKLGDGNGPNASN